MKIIIEILEINKADVLKMRMKRKKKKNIETIASRIVK